MGVRITSQHRFVDANMSIYLSVLCRLKCVHDVVCNRILQYWVLPNKQQKAGYYDDI